MKNQDYRKLGEEAINGKFAELENNLWEEGWADNPMSYRPLEHTITGIVSDCNGIVYLASQQRGYLPQDAKDAFENAGISFSDR